MSQQSEIQAEITAFDSNKRFETKTLTEPQVKVSYTFEPEDGRTRLKLSFVMLTNGLMRFLEPPIARSI